MKIYFVNLNVFMLLKPTLHTVINQATLEMMCCLIGDIIQHQYDLIFTNI